MATIIIVIIFNCAILFSGTDIIQFTFNFINVGQVFSQYYACTLLSRKNSTIGNARKTWKKKGWFSGVGQWYYRALILTQHSSVVNRNNLFMSGRLSFLSSEPQHVFRSKRLLIQRLFCTDMFYVDWHHVTKGTWAGHYVFGY